MTKPISIAIDGPGAAGKGTVAVAIAKALDYTYVDTGSTYRAVALLAHQAGVAFSDEPAVTQLAAQLNIAFRWANDRQRVLVNGNDVTEPLRTPAIAQGASDVSKLPAVRNALLGLQQQFGAAGGVVMDGRDIGTVVLPQAELKVYLDASLAVRANRRHLENLSKGLPSTVAQVHRALAARDAQDMGRAVAPLRCAPDGVVVDTTCLSIEASIAAVLALAHERLKGQAS